MHENISVARTGDDAEQLPGARLAHALVELTRAPMTSTTGDVLSEITVICQGAFWAPVAVSISLGDPTSPTLVATASKLAQSLDGAQMIAGEGPLHLSWARHETVHTSDLRHDRRWPRLALRVAGTGVCTAIAAPIRTGDDVAGSLSVYSVFPDLVDDAALETVELLSAAVAAVLHEAEAKRELRAMAAHLETALQSRATIDQAKGILMARHGCDADTAFRMLADASSSANVKLREIAERLVEDVSAGPHEDRRDGRRS